MAASPVHNLPVHNRNFVGRHDELRQLREILACNRIGAIAAVRGLGGIGKTALAYEYAHAFAEFYPGGRFVLRAEAAADFRAVVVDQLRDELGVELSDDEKKSYDLSFPRLWNVLKGRGRSLLVLDNLDQPELLAGAKQRGILPAGDAVHVLATTRLEADRLEDRQHVQCLLVDALPAEEGQELLKRFREPIGDAEWKASLALVHRLGGHALALEVVGVFLWKHPEVSYADYLARLEAEGAGAVEGAAKGTPVEQISRHPEKFIGRLLEPTLATLSPVEMRALEYAAGLPADSVPLPWLEALVRKDSVAVSRKSLMARLGLWLRGPVRNELAEALTKRPGYPDPWLEVIRRLDGLRLLVIDKSEPRLGRMHRVVRDVVIARMGVEFASERRQAATAYAAERADFLWDGWVDHEARWEIEPINSFALELLRESDISGVKLADPIQEALGKLGRMAERRSLISKAITVKERAFAPNHPSLAASYSNLAQVEQSLGNLTEARHLLHKAIAIDQSADESRHPGLVRDYANLASVEQDLGNLTVARDLLLEALTIELMDANKPERTKLAITYSNLALLEQQLGHLTEARTLLCKAITIQESAYEAGHPTLAVSYSNLGSVERELGNLSEARDLLHKAIAIKEQAYEPDHPSLAFTYANLAQVEECLGNHTEAYQLLKRAIAIEEKVYDPDHHLLAKRYVNLASVEQNLGNLNEARKLLRRAIVIMERSYDPGHPTLGISYSNLALVEQDLGNLNEAREFLRKSIIIMERVYESDHSDLAARYATLALIEQNLGNLADAITLARRAYGIFQVRFGEQDRQTQFILNWLIANDPDFSSASGADA